MQRFSIRRYSLRVLFCIIAVFSLVFFWLRIQLDRFAIQREEIEALSMKQVRVEFKPAAGQWLWKLLAPSRIDDFREVFWAHAGNSRVTDDDAIAISHWKSLETLYLQRSKITDAAMSNLGSLTRLETLNLSGVQGLTDNGVARLEGLHCLRWLQLDGTATTDEGVAAISKLVSLRTLTLQNTRISDASIKLIARLPMLEVLNLGGCNLTEDGLRQLETCRTLTDLRLGGVLSLETLTQLHSLDRLRLLSCTVEDDRTLEALSAFSRLEELFVGGQVTDDGVAYIATLPQLTRLMIESPVITDRTLDRLESAARLRDIDLVGTQVTQARAAKYMAAHPGVHIRGLEWPTSISKE